MLVILLAAALVLAVGLLLYGLGRIVYGIAHYHMLERQPPCEVCHPVYGLLTGVDGLWSGTARPTGRAVRFTVGGTDSAPDDALLRRVDALVGTLAEVERRAVDFLRTQEAEVSKAVFEVTGLDVTGVNHPDDFALEFMADGDDSRVWRVEFEAGQPKRTGFDD